MGPYEDGDEYQETNAALAEEARQPVLEANSVPSSENEHKHD